MSIRWHFMSSSPSSNTEKSPTGPAPTIATSVEITSFIVLSLSGRRRHDEAVQFLAHLDLAGEPRIGTHLEGEVEHVLLHLGGLADFFGPVFCNIDVAGRAGARPPALGLDARNRVSERRFHDGRAHLSVDSARLAFCVHKGHFCHRAQCIPGSADRARKASRLRAERGLLKASAGRPKERRSPRAGQGAALAAYRRCRLEMPCPAA